MYTTQELTQLRKRITHCMEESGIRLSTMAEKTGWKYSYLIDFKRAKVNGTEEKLQALKSWLDAHEPR